MLAVENLPWLVRGGIGYAIDDDEERNAGARAQAVIEVPGDLIEVVDDARAAELAAWTVIVSTIYNLDIAKTRQ